MSLGIHFSKFENDIKTAYESISQSKLPDDKNIYEVLKNNVTDNFLFEQLNSLNKVLFSIIDSYYFDGQNKNIHLVKSQFEDTNNFVYLLSKNAHNTQPEKVDFSNRFDWGGVGIHPLKDKYSLSNELSFVENFELNNFELNIIKTLKQQDPIYKILFEENELKQKMHLKDRYNYQITFVDTTNSKMDYELLTQFHKIDAYELNSYVGEDNKKHYYYNKDLRCSEDEIAENNLIQNLKIIYNLEYVNFENQSNGWFIAHNNYEIVGLATTARFTHEFEMGHKMKYINYIAVAEQFRGNKLGQKIFEKILEEGQKQDWVIERSHPSSNGKLYLKNNLDKITSESNIPIIDYNDLTSKISSTLKYIFKNEDTKHIEIDGLKSKIIFPEYNESKRILKELLKVIKPYIEERDNNLFNNKNRNYDSDFQIDNQMFNNVNKAIDTFLKENIKIELIEKKKNTKNKKQKYN